MINLENYKDPEGEILETYSVGDLLRIVQGWKENLELNHKNIYEVPVYLQDGFEKYVIRRASLSFGKSFSTSFSTSFEFSKTYGKCNFVAPDKRPEGGGEYWKTRGESDFDVSGFVVSKLAGERLLRMVKYILETDNPKTWLDYREFEPTWIQFKFSAEEFDVGKLSQMSKDNGGILTEQIVRECVKTKKDS